MSKMILIIVFTSTGLTLKPTRPSESLDTDDSDSFNPYTADVNSIMTICSDYLQKETDDIATQSSVFTVSELLVRCEELQADKEACECRIRELEKELEERSIDRVCSTEPTQYMKKVVVCCRT